ncbi:DGQHR domain-containing protein [Bradyrhizobium sp. i1.15.2]|uniref:DGQHR domain-containing protein n=1 Tax=Bradyrhizobium sp. i1.15.2 TaxID=3156362 RepID=UPI00339AE110
MQDELELVDPDPIQYEFSCIRASQPIGDIFVASIPFKTLIRMSYFDVRRVLQEERDIERYLGIQRPLEDRRVRSLSEYVNYKDASFPTSIILAIEEDYALFNDKKNTMTVSNKRPEEEAPSIAIGHLARVLDGQHRIAGLNAFRGATFDVPVTIFVGADISDQAHIFATVNLEQTKVQKSLVYDLFSLARTRSPQKTCHNIAVALDRDKKGPLHSRIKRLGFATEGRVFEPITQATFVEALMPYLSSAPKKDRDDLLRDKPLEKAVDSDLYRMPLRNLFVAERDLEITETVSNYFDAVKRRWPVAWDDQGRGMMLNRTNGFRALMRFFRHAYLDIAAPGDVPSAQKFFDRVFRPLELKDEDFTTENFVPGTGGEARLYRVLRKEEALS